MKRIWLFNNNGQYNWKIVKDSEDPKGSLKLTENQFRWLERSFFTYQMAQDFLNIMCCADKAVNKKYWGSAANGISLADEINKEFFGDDDE